jgi:glycosyltransferase involved in cell wall biosynthesis
MIRNENISPLISVIMPTYNGESFIKEAIESILIQTYTNFELLLIDDGSSDNTKSILEFYQNKDNRVRVILKSHTGATDSQNVGIKIARGKWIARCDQDDISESNRLEVQLDYVNMNPEILLLGSGFTEIDLNGLPVKIHNYPNKHKILINNLIRIKKFFPHSSAFYNRDTAIKLGCYNTRFTRADDYDFWLRFSQICKIGCINLPLVKIRKHPNQMSNLNNNTRSFYDSIAASTCYFLRIKNYNLIPSNEIDNKKWHFFLNWIEEEINKTNLLQSRNFWINSRKVILNNKNNNFIYFNLIFSIESLKYIFPSIFYKIFGLKQPEFLANKWIKLNNL